MLKTEIKNNLENFSNNDLLENSLNLFSILGYTTKRQYAVSSLDDFKNRFLTNSFNEDKLLFSEWGNAQFLFELQADDLNSEETTITTEIVDNKAIETYWFFAIELKGENYTKKQLSEITREINKQRPIPAFILFKYANKLTFSIIDRRLNKKDDNKDVLEKVVLIKDINYTNPHRAHIDILSDISFENIKGKFNVSNFVELHLNWLKALSVSELNKRFYTELSNWFFWTMDTCQLSKDNAHKDNVMFGIRMVTRIIFDWFIKEKGLVSEKVFDKQTYLDLLKPEYKEQGDLYYKVVLQNLFFGCLSKPMDRREFRPEHRYNNLNAGYDVNNLFRYAKYLNNPQDIVNMFKNIPFLNGGLFECTDDKRNGKYVDCFTDNDSRNFLKIPDDIFFMKDEKVVDISTHFDGNKSYKNAKVRGLFPILNSYKFTIDETTPVEEEIALDPELLGRVFENLLAAHNPETKTTARKSTGSYYTPREIVDYMCEQSLINYLKTKVEQLNIENLDDKLTELLSYADTHSFTEFEVDELIKAVNEVKILDPACGSGAFPMGLLHKLVHVLSKLDPHNEKWKESQIDKASQIDDIEAREEAIKIIEKQFNDNEMDYSRKLYLIQRCIYGVDIQPMATQISRLRFFISLIVDEKPNKSKPNMGILALPNLETKFVAANTLIDLPQNNLFSTFPTIVQLREELEKVRAMHFRANSGRKKTEIQNKDNELRLRIKQEAITLGATFESAARIAEWSPYDKDKSSDWFNPKWMFNVDKFDIVIGNPPYINTNDMKDFKDIYRKLYSTAYGSYDIYVLFYERGLSLLKNNANLSFITSNKFLIADYGINLRKLLLKETQIINILDLADCKRVFSEALVSPCITLIQNTLNNDKDTNVYILKDNDVCNISNIEPKKFPKNKLGCDKNVTFDIQISSENESILVKLLNNSKVLDKVANIRTGVMGFDYWSLDEFIYENKQDGFIRIATNSFVAPYRFLWGKKVNLYKKNYYNTWLDIEKCSLNKNTKEFFKLPKIIIRGVAKKLTAQIDKEGVGLLVAVHSAIPKNEQEYSSLYILSLLNSKLLNYYHIMKFYTARIPEGSLKYPVAFLKTIPIKICSKEMQQQFDNIANKILNNTESNDYDTNKEKQNKVAEYEKQIDVMVYKLYELTYPEVKIIDPNFSMSEEEYNKYII